MSNRVQYRPHKESQNFLWFKITKEYDTNTKKDIYVCGTYIPPQNSIYFYPELFEELENDIEKFSAFGSILLSNLEQANTQTIGLSRGQHHYNKRSI